MEESNLRGDNFSLSMEAGVNVFLREPPFPQLDSTARWLPGVATGTRADDENG